MKRLLYPLLFGLVVFILIAGQVSSKQSPALSADELLIKTSVPNERADSPDLISQAQSQPSPKLIAAREKAKQLNEDFPGWKESLPACPCTDAEAQRSSEFTDSWFLLSWFHPGAKTSYRSRNPKDYPSPVRSGLKPLRPGQQCTYDAKQRLITQGPGAGTPDAYGSEGTDAFSFLHTDWDVKTFKAMDLDEYLKTWTPNNANQCPINPEIKGANSFGDPHLITFDGLRYSFQTVGEFILIKSNDGKFEVQARQVPVNSSLSLNSAVALRVGENRIALYASDFPDETTSTPLRVDGKPITIQKDKFPLSGGGEVLKQGADYVVNFPTGEKVVIAPTRAGENSYFNISPVVYQIPEYYSGLLGNINGNLKDDQQIRGGKNIVEVQSSYGDVSQVLNLVGLRTPGILNAAEKVYFDRLYKEFGNSWRVKAEESLFDYPVGKTAKNYIDPAFPDKYLTLNMLSADQIQKARDACTAAKVSQDLMEGCIFDVGFSGFSEFARATAEINGYVSIVNQLFPRLNIPTPEQAVDRVIQKVKPKVCLPLVGCL